MDGLNKVVREVLRECDPGGAALRAKKAGLHDAKGELTSRARRLWFDYAALEEGSDPLRQKLIRMNLAELTSVIALREKKARETMAAAEMLKSLVGMYPEWEQTPSMILAEVLGVKEKA